MKKKNMEPAIAYFFVSMFFLCLALYFAFKTNANKNDVDKKTEVLRTQLRKHADDHSRFHRLFMESLDNDCRRQVFRELCAEESAKVSAIYAKLYPKQP